jgi:hypothetical protein
VQEQHEQRHEDEAAAGADERAERADEEAEREKGDVGDDRPQKWRQVVT